MMSVFKLAKRDIKIRIIVAYQQLSIPDVLHTARL